VEIKHYNAIAKIVGGVLDNNERLQPMINTLVNYFESEDETFNSREFRSACLNGSYMNEEDESKAIYAEDGISPRNTQNRAYT
tara:strand:- start:635 stop:883 length:249 start_codon:yes stop_codon:yes gene_type:complete